ncbi:MAG: orotate phosphoribosyltransferase [Nanoarchaeota archaeon]
MDKLGVCSICRKNLASQPCKFCGNITCLNCSKKGICKNCMPSA